MKSTEELITEISLASRITRDARLLALLEDIRKYLEVVPRLPDRAPPTPQAGRTNSEKYQDWKRGYMRRYMRERRAKQKEAKLAIINSVSKDSIGTIGGSGISDQPELNEDNDSGSAKAQESQHQES